MISNIVVIRFLTVFKGNTSFYNKNELPKVKPEGGKFKTKITTVKEKLTKEKLYYYRQVPPVPEPNNQEYNTGN